ncbi:nucleoid occlusion protein [Salipaludibacillus sp. LMS25]|jgi:ParB family chromosome partitioning protein|uniref:nucleoid occlusion protein n=1 Tax=Salipaludibacillus sp. LMS25 TaxID=2924031 RepID=UPI0020D06E10|nr:nucleoid occlusion protein [Salipaludibacillus sp. LMS25]UTR16577.1 nucleoid occlusion protein [Salipaludibacillus sp. LMS25]
MKQSFSKLFGLNEKNEGSEDNLMSETEEVKQLPVADIVPNRYQPRTVFHDDKIDELAQTIKTHGIIQPIVVRERNGRFEIIAGERRWRAVTKLGWEHISAVIKDLDDTKTASVALIENLQREGLTSIEEAMAYAKLLDLHGLTQESLAQRLGKGQSTVANKLRLLNLPASVQDALLNRRITERHARALIGLKDQEKQEKVLERIIEQELNVKQTEELIAKISEGVPKKKPKAIRKAVSKDTRLAMNTIRKSVDMVAQTGMTIDTDEEEHDDYYQFTIRIPKK